MIGAKFKNGSRDFRVFCHHMLEFDIVYLHAKFDDSSFSRSRYIIGGGKI